MNRTKTVANADLPSKGWQVISIFRFWICNPAIQMIIRVKRG